MCIIDHPVLSESCRRIIILDSFSLGRLARRSQSDSDKRHREVAEMHADGRRARRLPIDCEQ